MDDKRKSDYESSKPEMIKSMKTGILQRYLYKYVPLETAKIIIESGQFKFSSRTEFNDPFDCNLLKKLSFDLSDLQAHIDESDELSHLNSPDAMNILSEEKNDLGIAIGEAMQGNMDQLGILCLSRNKDNILMWSHYAAGHTGLVFELDVTEDMDFFFLPFGSPIDIRYQSGYDIVNYARDKKRAIVNNLMIKSIFWSYEEETRILREKHNTYPIKKSAISAVYFGCEMDKRKILETIDLFIDNKYLNADFYQAVAFNTKFSLTFLPVPDLP